MGGNNILNKSAMEQIAEMANELPRLRIDFNKEIGILSERMGIIETKVDTIHKDMETEPLRCQYRETIAKSEAGVKRLDKEVGDLDNEQVAQGKDLEAVKTRINVFGGLNAAYTTIFTAIMNGLKGGP